MVPEEALHGENMVGVSVVTSGLPSRCDPGWGTPACCKVQRQSLL